MDYQKFVKEFDAYMATPQAQIDIDAMMERIEKETIEDRNKLGIPLHFTTGQEETLMSLRMLGELADEVIEKFLKEQAARKHKKELEEEEAKDIYDSRD